MFIIIYIIFAVLVGVYASSKGRTGFGFFLIAMILDPIIGLIIALVISPVNKIVDQNALSTGEFKKCPRCAELVKAEASLCKHCGTELSETGAINTNQNIQQTTNSTLGVD